MNEWRRAAKALGVIVYGVSVLRAVPAQGAVWTRGYVRALPDEAFAVIEVRPDGRRLRRLPHHDAEGRVDLAHLRNAMSRLRQVKWLDPANAEQARQHLFAHGNGVSPAGRGSRGAAPRRGVLDGAGTEASEAPQRVGAGRPER